MPRIAIVSLAISRGDAVGNDALEMQRILTARGHAVELFSSHWAKTYLDEGRGRPAQFSGRRSADGILIYHHAIGWGGARVAAASDVPVAS